MLTLTTTAIHDNGGADGTVVNAGTQHVVDSTLRGNTGGAGSGGIRWVGIR